MNFKYYIPPVNEIDSDNYVESELKNSDPNFVDLKLHNEIAK